MFTRIIQRIMFQVQKNYFNSIVQTRTFIDANKLFLPAGGLERLQGGVQEQQYFRDQNLELMTKIREQGEKLKCEECLDITTELSETLINTSEMTAVRDSCCANKHKNCREEAFFLTELKECWENRRSKIGTEEQNSQSDSNKPMLETDRNENGCSSTPLIEIHSGQE